MIFHCVEHAFEFIKRLMPEPAKEHAEREFTEYRRVKDHTLESDFDRAIQ